METDSCLADSAPSTGRVGAITSNRKATTWGGTTRIRPFVVAGLVLLTFAVYVDSISGSFVYDDLTVIGPHLSTTHWSASTIARVFTRDFWSGIRPDQSEGALNSIYYRPLFSLYLMLIYSLAGKNAALWHFIILGMHILAVLFAYKLMDRSLRLISTMGNNERCFLAGFAAAIFAVHPVQSESVAWISAIGNPSSTILIFAVVYWYLKYLEDGKARQIALSIGAFALAVLWKENALVLLLVLPAYDLLRINNAGLKLGRRIEKLSRPLNKSEFAKRLTTRLLPFVVVAMGYFALRYLVLGTFLGHYKSANFPDDSSLTLWENLLTLPALILSYLGMMLTPANLSAFYGFTYVRFATIASFWSPLVPIVFVIAILSLGCRKWPELRLAAVWMIVPLLPHLNTLGHSSEELIQDHYLYLPLLGFGLLVGSVAVRLDQRSRSAVERRIIGAIAAIVIIGLSILTARQNRVWQNQELLWSSAAASAPNSRIVHLELGRLAEARGDMDLAEREYRTVLSINPDIIDGLNNLAFVEAKGHRWEEATAGFERVVALSPQKAIAHFNLAFAYNAQSRSREGARELQVAIDLDPTGPRADEWRRMLEKLKKG